MIARLALTWAAAAVLFIGAWNAAKAYVQRRPPVSVGSPVTATSALGRVGGDGSPGACPGAHAATGRPSRTT